MLSIKIPWNSDFPVGIRWNPQELMEESKDLINSTGMRRNDRNPAGICGVEEHKFNVWKRRSVVDFEK